MEPLYAARYPSPVGELTVVCDKGSIVGLWIENQKHFFSTLPSPPIFGIDTPLLRQARQWLDAYFQGQAPSPDTLPLKPGGSGFQQRVWAQLLRIPYGQTVTYGQLAKAFEGQKMSAQAIGGAVGRNPISIIVPCHRVLGAKGQLTGYASGTDKKLWLLRHEGAQILSL